MKSEADHPHDIKKVSDTAMWVAAYRAEENARKDAFFSDPYAHLLVGEDGAKLATRTQGSRFTSWSVIIRTKIIDDFILRLLPDIDIVLNLGAGLDTRPYRLNLPEDLLWYEVDFPEIINLKLDRLQHVTPACRLFHRSFDLLDLSQRSAFFNEINSQQKKVLILTEGVMPYLSNADVHRFATNLHSCENFCFWINEYYSPEILEFLRTPKRQKQMRNAPFLFYPEDWFQFYADTGWKQVETKFFGVESQRLGRTPPVPGWTKDAAADISRYLGYSLYQR